MKPVVMTIGEKLLDLTIEYQESKAARVSWNVYGAAPAGREPADIAADYSAAMRKLVVGTQEAN